MNKKVQFSNKTGVYLLRVFLAGVLLSIIGIVGTGQTLQVAAEGLTLTETNNPLAGAVRIAPGLAPVSLQDGSASEAPAVLATPATNDDFPGTVVQDLPFEDLNVDTTVATSDTVMDPLNGDTFIDPTSIYLGDCNSNQGEASVWYNYTPTENVSVYADTIGSDYDTLLAVWKGDPENLTLVTCNDDISSVPPFNKTSKTGFFAQAGTTYYIEVIEWTQISSSDDQVFGGTLNFHMEEGNFSVTDVYIGGVKKGSYAIPYASSVPVRFGINGGPVHVVGTNLSSPIFTSQRAYYGSSFNSIVGFPSDQLATEYWFTTLDDLGMITYLVIGNPSSTETALVDVYIGGNKMNVTPYSIAPGQRIYPRYGINGGPVHVVSTNSVPIFASERTKYKDSFNEVMGFPGDQLATDYWFTSLDDLGMITYLVIGNPDATQTALVDVYIGGNKMNVTPYSIAPGQRVYPRYGINGGPVHVVSTNGVAIFTSERTKYQNSFNEVMGYPGNRVATEFWFTTLDDANMITYLVIGNPSSTETALVDVYIGGNKMNITPYSIAPGQRVFPRYGIKGGPVQVVSVSPDGGVTPPVAIFASERSKYLSSFNEILGLPDNELTTDYWFTSLDDLGMSTELVISSP